MTCRTELYWDGALGEELVHWERNLQEDTNLHTLVFRCSDLKELIMFCLEL